MKFQFSMWMFYIKNHRNSSEINLKLNIENSIGFVETFKYGNPYFWVVVCYVFRKTYFINDYMNKPWNVTLSSVKRVFVHISKTGFFVLGISDECKLSSEDCISAGKSLSEALLFAEHVVYRNCSECHKQFLYTSCSPRVWAWNFHVLNL